MAKAVVTGGAGFIGSHMVDLLLREGHDVVVVDDFSSGRPQNLAHHAGNTRLQVQEADVAAVERVTAAFAGARWVFHFAALGDIVPSIERPRDYVRANVMGTLGALEAARAAGVECFVYSASSSCYGLPDVTPTPETAPIRTEYPYALSKYLGERMTLHWGRVYGLPVVSLRYFNVYGPRSRTSGAYGAVFGVFLKQKLAGHPFTVVGDGTQSRDFVYVTDVARANYLAACTPRARGEIFNVGAGAPQSVNRLVELLGGEAVHVPKRPGEPDVTHADITKIRKALDWTPTVPFEQGVARMLAGIEDWKDAPLWTPAKIADATKTWFEYLGRPNATAGPATGSRKARTRSKGAHEDGGRAAGRSGSAPLKAGTHELSRFGTYRARP
jgi:UDP-glucose 4-epimerase